MIAVIVKSSVSLIIFFGLYRLLLKNGKFFVFNRFFLIASLVLSLAIPFVSIPVSFRTTGELERFSPVYRYFIVSDGYPAEAAGQGVNAGEDLNSRAEAGVLTGNILLALYLAGVLFFLARFVVNLYNIVNRKKRYEKIVLQGYRVILTDEREGPYCFFKTIFLNRDAYLKGLIDDQVLSHEMEHARQSHSIDIILIELIRIIYWFNPVYILYDRAIRVNHEYLADKKVIRGNADILSYSVKLIDFISYGANLSMTSGSGSTFARERLQMMLRSERGRINRGFRITASVIAAAVLMLLLSFRESGKEALTSGQRGTEILNPQNLIKGTVLTKDGRPIFGATIKAAGLQSESVEAVAGADGGFTLEDVRPGATLLVQYRGFKDKTVTADSSKPVIVRLERDPDFKGRATLTEIKPVNFRNDDFSPAQAVISVDGVVLSDDAGLIFSTNDIKTIKILTGREAEDKYGTRATNGAVEIQLYANQSGGTLSKVRAGSVPDSSRYVTGFSVNHRKKSNEPIGITVSGLQSVTAWYYNDLDKSDRKEYRAVAFMSRDYYRVRGRVTRENGKALPGVSISATDNPAKVISDRDGRFLIEDVREGAIVEFSHPEYESHYLSTLYEVAFNEDMNITLLKKGSHKNEEPSAASGRGSVDERQEAEKQRAMVTNSGFQATAGLSEASTVKILKFLAANTGYPAEARNLSDTGRIYVNVKIAKGGVVGECTTTPDKSATKSTRLPEIVIVGYGKAPGETVSKSPEGTLNEHEVLRSECLRIAGRLNEVSVPEWLEKDIEFTLTFNFVIKPDNSSKTFSSSGNVQDPFVLRK